MLSLPYRSPNTWDLLQFVRVASCISMQEKALHDSDLPQAPYVSTAYYVFVFLFFFVTYIIFTNANLLKSKTPSLPTKVLINCLSSHNGSSHRPHQ